MSEWLLRNHREIGRRDGARSMILRRDYPAPIDDVWSACTEPDRLSRWFLKVSGDLRGELPESPVDDWYEPGDEQQRLAGIVAGAWVSLAQAEGLPLPPLPPGWT